MVKEKQGPQKKIIGSRETKEQPRLRLNVFRSGKHIYAALIDDSLGKTIFSASDKDIKQSGNLPKMEKSFLVGKTIAEKALKRNFKKVVFDRASYLYHGRVKKLAEGARAGGLEF